VLSAWDPCPTILPSFWGMTTTVPPLWESWVWVPPFKRLLKHRTYRNNSLYCASQMLRFFFSLQIEGLWQPCVEQVYRRHISNCMCSLRVSMSHFGNSRNISNSVIITVSVMVICDVTIVIVLGHHEQRPYKTANFMLCVLWLLHRPAVPPPSLSLLGPPYSMRHNIEIRPISNPGTR
jgi:hypothetical protein